MDDGDGDAASERDARYLDVALDRARAALAAGQFPVGAVVALDGEIIAAEHNLVDARGDDLAHAETRALAACAPRLFEAKGRGRVEVFSTLEPCLMCFGALAHVRAARLVFGAYDAHAGAFAGAPVDALAPYYRGRIPAVVGGVRVAACLTLFEEYVARTGWRRGLLEKLTATRP